MEHCAIEIARLSQFAELVDMRRRDFRKHLDHDLALGRVEDEHVFRINLAPAFGLGSSLSNRRSLYICRRPGLGQRQSCQACGNDACKHGLKFHFWYFSTSWSFTAGVTKAEISPPNLAISLTSRDATA